MKVLTMYFLLMFLMTATLHMRQQGSSLDVPPKPIEVSALCRVDSLPSDLRSRLKGEFRSWKVQEPTDLSPSARVRWNSERPLECPGIAVGFFESTEKSSYAILLVPLGHADAGYRFLVFSHETSQSAYETRIVEKSDENGAANFFIRRVPISKFFDEHSRRKFQVQTTEGILLVDSAEKEYECDFYFWANGSYQHQPVDY